jgi:hypothetical protein
MASEGFDPRSHGGTEKIEIPERLKHVCETLPPLW